MNMSLPSEPSADQSPGSAGDAPPSRSAWGLVLTISALAFLLAGLSELGWGHGAGAPAWQALGLSLLALPLVLGGGAALGPLLFATPAVEPSPLKLGLFASVLSPVLVAGLWYAFAYGGELPPQRAWAATFLAVGFLAPLGIRARISTARAGRAAGLTCFVGLVAGAALCALVWSPDGLAARLSSSETIAQATLAQSLQDGAPLTNPWMSGLALELRPALAAMLVAVSGPGQLLPLFAMGFWIAWCVFGLAVGGYLASAALFRETSIRHAGVRDFIAAIGVVLVACALDGGRFGLHRWLSMALTLTFAVAALHTIRRGARPWPGLACVLLLVLGLLHPWVAGALGTALALAALVARRWWLPSVVGLALLPGFFVGRVCGGLGFEQAIPYRGPASVPTGLGAQFAALQDRFVGPLGGAPIPSAEVLGTMVPIVLAGGLIALLALVGPSRSRAADLPPEDVGASRTGATFLAFSILSLVLVAWQLPTTALTDAADLWGAALLLAALGLGRIVHLLRWGKAAGAVGLALLVWMGQPALRHLTTTSGRALPFEETPLQLNVAQEVPLQSGLPEALAFVRSSEYARDPMSVLMREPGPVGPVPRSEPLSIAPLLTGMGLWGGRAASPGSDQSRALAPARGELRTGLGDTPIDRRELLNALFELEGKWHPRFDRVLKRARELGHTFVFVVTEADRRATTERGTGPRGVDDVLLRMGAEEVFQKADVSVYVAPALGG